MFVPIEGLLADIYFIRLTIDVTLIILAILLPGWFSGAYIIFVTNFINIIGIIFATAWAINQRMKTRRMVKFNADVHAHTTCTMIQIPATFITDTFSVNGPPVVGPLLSSAVSHTSGLVSRGDTSESSSPITYI